LRFAKGKYWAREQSNKEVHMRIFGMPMEVSWYYWVSLIVVPIIIEIVLRSKWWKKKMDYYFSFNQEQEDDK